MLTLAKATSTVAPFVERAERKTSWVAPWLLALSLPLASLGDALIVSGVRRLRATPMQSRASHRRARAALAVGQARPAHERWARRAPGRQHYVESTVRALTHELKSPIAAIRG